MKTKQLSGKKLTKALDDTVREILHAMYPNPVCFVYGTYRGWFHPKTNKYGCQVGHYISRRVGILRWDLLNIFPQSSISNQEHQWNTLPFTKKILDVCGQERINYLNEKYKDYKQKGVIMSQAEKRLLLLELQEQLDKLTKKQTV